MKQMQSFDLSATQAAGEFACAVGRRLECAIEAGFGDDTPSFGASAPQYAAATL